MLKIIASRSADVPKSSPFSVPAIVLYDSNFTVTLRGLEQINLLINVLKDAREYLTTSETQSWEIETEGGESRR